MFAIVPVILVLALQSINALLAEQAGLFQLVLALPPAIPPVLRAPDQRRTNAFPVKLVGLFQLELAPILVTPPVLLASDQQFLNVHPASPQAPYLPVSVHTLLLSASLLVKPATLRLPLPVSLAFHYLLLSSSIFLLTPARPVLQTRFSSTQLLRARQLRWFLLPPQCCTRC